MGPNSRPPSRGGSDTCWGRVAAPLRRPEHCDGADLSTLGSLMSASHRSLRDLHEVSTPTLDAVAGAARAVSGCAGSRLVGAGFGGTVIALVDRSATDACRQAMAGACAGGETFELRPSAGVAVLAPDVVRG